MINYRATTLQKRTALRLQRRAEAKRLAGDYKGAVLDADKALAIDPKCHEALYTRGEAKRMLGDDQGAIEDCNRCLAIAPKYHLALYTRGNAKSMLGDYQGAIEDSNQCLAIAPKYHLALYTRGDAKRMLGDYQGAIEDSNQCLAIAPKYHLALYTRGEAKRCLGDYQGAIEDCTQCLAIDPKDYFALYTRGEAKRMLGDFERAIEDCNQCLAIDSKYHEALRTRGAAKYELGNYLGAIEDCNQCLAIDPKYYKALQTRGETKKMLGDFEGAIEDCNQCLAIDSKDHEALRTRGAAKYELGNYLGAIEDCNQCLAIDSKYHKALQTRGAAKYELGNYLEAIEDCNQCLAIAPKYHLALYTRGNAKSMLGDYQGAIEDSNQCLAIAPKYHLALYTRGDAKRMLGDDQGAIEDSNQCLAIDPKYHLALYTRGDAKRILGDYQGAIEDCNQCLAIDPKYQLALYTRGDAKRELGDFEGAIEDCTQCLAIDPKDYFALYTRGEAKRMLDDYKGAIEDCNQCLAIEPEYHAALEMREEAEKQLKLLAQVISPLKKPEQVIAQQATLIPPVAVVPLPEKKTEKNEAWPTALRIIERKHMQMGHLINQGGFGKVYQATWHGNPVAVKQLHLQNLTHDLNESFRQEAELMASLHFSNVIHLYGISVETDYYAMVMEYCEKGSLYQVLHNSKMDLPWQPLRWQIAIETGKGLAYLHSLNVIHQDLKSLNVLLDAHFHAKIADFGMSRLKLETATTTKLVEPKTGGSVRWRAPELFKRRAKPNQASDIYSYGTVLWEIASRQLPFNDEPDDQIVISWIKDGEKERLPDDCPPAYGQWIEQCWANSAERPSATEVHQALQIAQTAANVKPKKSWYFSETVKTKLKDLPRKNALLEVGEEDKKFVVQQYQHHPVPGMDIKKVEIVYNPVMNHKFELHMQMLQKRAGNIAFAPEWQQLPGSREKNERNKVHDLAQTLAQPYSDSDSPDVKLLPLWHGTKRAVVESLIETGYANLGKTDDGYFGKGIYSAHEAEYAYRVYGQEGVIILNWVSYYSAYPVIWQDKEQNLLFGKANYSNYDAHFLPVIAQIGQENEIIYWPCKPGQKHTYIEVVTFESAQCLPRYLVELQPTFPLEPLLMNLALKETTNPAKKVATSVKHSQNPYTLFAKETIVKAKAAKPPLKKSIVPIGKQENPFLKKTFGP